MAVYIELYFLAYFSLFLFLMFSIKLFLCTKARILSVCAASIMFSIICFLMDFYAISIIWKALIICVYVIALTLVLHKLSHISKLLIAAGIGIFYYFCLGGINWFITTKLLNLPIYINNFYLSLMIGINGIIFSVCFLVCEFMQSEKHFKLARKCVLVIGSQKFELLGFLDTGNLLKEPVSGKSVVIIAIDSLKKGLSNKMYADLLFATNSSGFFNNIQKLKCQTINGVNFVTIFQPKMFSVGGEVVDCFVGVSFQKLRHEVLLNSSFV